MEYFFIHNEWSDTCILEKKNIINRKNINNEKGYYYYQNSLLVVKWDKWDDNDYYVRYDNLYIDKIFKDSINNLKLITIQFHNDSIECILLNNNEIIKKMKKMKEVLIK